MEKVSIIIPVFNAEKYLDECLLSVTGQSYRNIEIICIDDGSQDNSRAICEDWAMKDRRVHYTYQDNQGVSSARNKGLEISTGNYVCFVDSDDIIHYKFVETLLEKCVSGNAVICDITRKNDLGCGDKTRIWPMKSFVRKVIFERIKHPGFTCFLYIKEVIDRNNIRFHEGCAVNEDYEFYLKYLTACGDSVALLDYKGYYYRENEGSVLSAPVSYKNLTSIDAAKRINEFLYQKGFIRSNKILFSNSVLIYLYAVSKQNNRELFDYLHNQYNIRDAMKSMLFFPRFGKKLVAILYLTFGPNIFFKIIHKVIK